MCLMEWQEMSFYNASHHNKGISREVLKKADGTL